MFGTLAQIPEDKILQLMRMFQDDPRSDKLDLGVGVYKDANGRTPVMRAIKSAEHTLWTTEDTKTYVGLAGDPAYHNAIRQLVLGESIAATSVATIHTPGGTGAFRQALELMRMASPDATIWVSNPTWPNHTSIIRYLGISAREYRYFDDETRAVDFAGMHADLSGVKRGDVVLLHGCCHNPTGADPNAAQWAEIAALLQKTGAVPLIDIAYQGFGEGIEEDAAATRLIAAAVPETLIAVSCSKNFGIYRERTGALLAVTPDQKTRDITQSNLTFLNRQNYSFPPDHGARLVTMILNDPALRADWMSELDEIRRSMRSLRHGLASALREASGSDRFAYLALHNGMFSRLGATPDQVDRLRKEHGIYIVGDSRMNIAGLNAQSIQLLAKAIIDCGI